MNSGRYLKCSSVVIYCRVSSQKQVREGNGLDSQEAKCRTWCRSRNLDVLKVFREEGISGGKKDRPALMNMFSFLEEVSKKNTKCIVLVEDLNRWSRETVNHFMLKQTITSLGHSLQSVNMSLDDTDESEFMETVAAGISQLERKKNAKRTKTCMQEHAKMGFWLMNPPTGYKRERINGHIHCVRKEPTASYIQEALEGFANFRFHTQKDVYNYLKMKEIIGYDGKPTKISLHFVKNMLINERYTGCFAYDRWNIPYQKWAIEEIISRKTYDKIQERLNRKKSCVQVRKYNLDDEEFPLRRWVRCNVCGTPLTASKSTSKSGKRHSYYHCHNKACPMRGKGIRQEVIHEDFKKILNMITPNSKTISLIQALIKDKEKTESENWRNIKKLKEQEIKNKKEEKEKCFELLLKNDNPEVMKMCNEKIAKLEIEIKELTREIEDNNVNTQNLEKIGSKVFDFISKPLAVWNIGNHKQRQGVLKLCFSEPISYDRTKKFGTPKLSSIFSMFNNFSGKNHDWRPQRDSNSCCRRERAMS